LPLRF
uniref:FMRFamide-like neuropeptide n=1 Tax=Gallus gallus TaxID=9031 RepID=FARP_CHICK